MQVLSAAEQTRLVENIAGHMKDAQEFIQKRAVNNFAQADPEFGRRLRELLAQYKGQASASGVRGMQIQIYITSSCDATCLWRPVSLRPHNIAYLSKIECLWPDICIVCAW